MKSRLVATLLSLSLILATAASAVAEERPVVKIGALLPLTGDLAHIGEDIRRGMELGLKGAGDLPVRLEIIYEDNQHNARTTVSAAQKLLDVDKVDILTTLWDMADVVAPLAESKKVPHVSIRWNPHIAEKYHYTFTFESTYLSYAKAQMELLRELGVKTIGLMTEEAQGWLLAAEAARKLAPEFGIRVVSDVTFTKDTVDLRPSVMKLVGADPDMVIVSALQPALDIALRRIREIRPHQRITGYFETVKPLSVAEGLPFVAQFSAAPWFAERFKEAYGQPFDSRAPHGYDLIGIVAAIYRNGGRKLTSDEFVAALSTLSGYEGATGALSVNATKNIENECVRMVVKDGVMIPLTEGLLGASKVVALS